MPRRHDRIEGPARLAAGRHTLRFTGLSTDEGRELTIWRMSPGDTVEAVRAQMHATFDADDGAGLQVPGAGREVAEHALGWILPPDGGTPLTIGLDLTPGRYVVIAQDIDSDGDTDTGAGGEPQIEVQVGGDGE